MIKINIPNDKLEKIKSSHLLFSKIYVLPKLIDKLSELKQSNYKDQISFYELLKR